MNTILEIFFYIFCFLFYFKLILIISLPFGNDSGGYSLDPAELILLFLMVILSFGIEHPWNIGPLKIFLFGIISILISYGLAIAIGYFLYYLTKKKEINKKSDDKF
jgi:hypothetical protein